MSKNNRLSISYQLQTFLESISILELNKNLLNFTQK